jgi:hypothetical protein
MSRATGTRPVAKMELLSGLRVDPWTNGARNRISCEGLPPTKAAHPLDVGATPAAQWPYAFLLGIIPLARGLFTVGRASEVVVQDAVGGHVIGSTTPHDLTASKDAAMVGHVQGAVNQLLDDDQG